MAARGSSADIVADYLAVLVDRSESELVYCSVLLGVKAGKSLRMHFAAFFDVRCSLDFFNADFVSGEVMTETLIPEWGGGRRCVCGGGGGRRGCREGEEGRGCT